MANGREEDEREDAPRIRVVDRRMLNEDERSGKVTPTPPATGKAAPATPPAKPAATAPAPELIKAASAAEAPSLATIEPESEDLQDERPSEEEMAQMREDVEEQQFAAIEQQMGRALTEEEKIQVRAEMDKEAKSMAALEVAPVLARLLAELSARAAVHMGLMPNPYSRLIAKNDTEARLAIDAFGAIFEVIKGRLDEVSQREYARVFNDLRVNFASQTGSIVSPTGGAAGGGSRIIH